MFGIDSVNPPRLGIVKRSDKTFPVVMFGTYTTFDIVQNWGNLAGTNISDAISNRMSIQALGGTIIYQGSAAQDYGIGRNIAGIMLRQSTTGYTGDILQLQTSTPTNLAGYNAVVNHIQVQLPQFYHKLVAHLQQLQEMELLQLLL